MLRARYLLGLLVLAATCVGAWFLIRLLDRDDTSGLFPLQVEFREVAGLKTGGDVKYRGVRVGRVQRVTLTKTGSHAVVNLLLDDQARNLARDNSRFWIVTPRFHGVREGLSGLETIVRNSYLAFVTPEPFGEELKPHSQLIGEETPYVLEQELSLPKLEHGDLTMHLLVPQNHGLAVGVGVLFRGMSTGEVRSIRLAPAGTHVDVEMRIGRRHRATVTDKSLFWVARPSLPGTIFTGFSLNDVGALLSPHVSYLTEPGAGVPAPENHRVIALPGPPDLGDVRVPEDALRQGATGTSDLSAWKDFALVLVKYSAEDVDWLTPNDDIYREGTGILYSDSHGRGLVLTARSVCDARYDYRETFGGKGDIRREELRVRMPGGQWLRANRISVGKNEQDLALLQLSDKPPRLKPTDAKRFRFEGAIEEPSKLELRIVNKDGLPQKAIPLRLGDKLTQPGGIVVRAGKVVGILGRRAADDAAPAIVPLSAIPESLRPRL